MRSVHFLVRHSRFSRRHHARFSPARLAALASRRFLGKDVLFRAAGQHAHTASATCSHQRVGRRTLGVEARPVAINMYWSLAQERQRLSTAPCPLPLRRLHLIDEDMSPAFLLNESLLLYKSCLGTRRKLLNQPGGPARSSCLLGPQRCLDHQRSRLAEY